MQPPQLNVDILANACEFLRDISDILSVSLTCSTAHVFAVRWLLLTRLVHLKNGPSIYRFHSFLLANVHARGPYVRALLINLRWPQPQADDTPLLLEILLLCNNLEHLTVAFQKVSRTTVADPRFLTAITAIPNLRSFNVRSTSKSIDALSLLPQFQTSVRMLGIHYSNICVASRHPAVLEHFIPRILVQTLEELELDEFAVDLRDETGVQTLANIFLPPVLNTTPYPAVRSLSVGIFRGRPLLNLLQHLFPALDGALRLGSLNIRPSEEVYAILRTANRHSQERDAHGVSHAWKKLDRLICDASMLYVLGLRCPIRLIMLDSVLSSENSRYAADALRENPVPQLKISALLDFGATFHGVFSPELAGTLTHFTLCLFYARTYGSASSESQENDLTWDHVLDTLVSVIRPLHRLTHLHIVIGVCVYVGAHAPWQFAPEEEYANSFRRSSFDWDRSATTLSGALPSLQYIFLTTDGFLSNWNDEAGSGWEPYERWHITHGWRVVNTHSRTDDALEGGHTGLVELHDDVSETIIRKEELVLSSLDEAGLHLNYGWGRIAPPLSVS